MTSAIDRYLDDPMAFRREQLVLTADGTLLGDVVEEWQEEEIFAPLDELQKDGRHRYRLCYFELPRGHAKTTSIAGEAVTQLVLAPTEWRGHVVAGDKDQARELFDAAVGFIRRNPLLAPAFQIKRDRIVALHTGSILRVHSSDAPTAYGLIVDWFAFDEFWVQQSRVLWDAFYTAAVKRPNWRGIVITTAGFDKNSICWQVRELARSRDDFYAFIAPGQLASWISDEEVERMRATLPAHVFQRFVENKWVEETGSFVTAQALARCFDDRLHPLSHGKPNVRYYLAVDLGLKKDRTAAAVVHRADHREVSPEGSIVLDDLMVWEGSRGEPVSIAEVERWVEIAAKRFRLRRILIDPWQAASTVERFRGLVEEFYFTPQSVSRLSSNLFQLIQSGALRLFPDDDLERELIELQAEQTSWGWRIDHKRNKHDDRAMAIGMAALAAVDESPTQARVTRARIGSSPRKRPLERLGGTQFYLDEDDELAMRRIGEGR